MWTWWRLMNITPIFTKITWVHQLRRTLYTTDKARDEILLQQQQLGLIKMNNLSVEIQTIKYDLLHCTISPKTRVAFLQAWSTILSRSANFSSYICTYLKQKENPLLTTRKLHINWHIPTDNISYKNIINI